MSMTKSRKKKSPKRVLAIPDLEHAKMAVLNSLTSASGQRTYDHAIREFVAWYCSEPRLAFNRSVVLRYRIHLEQRGYAPATINLRLAAVRRIAYEAADAGLLSPELAAGIRRVKGVRRIGVRLGNWLTPEQGRRLLECAVPSTTRDLRDHAMVAMLIGCGLRRAELLALRVESIQQREEHWVIADLVGKAGHVRTVPIPTWVKAAVDAWTAAARITDGPVFRAINKTGRVWGDGMSPKCCGMSSAPLRLARASTSSPLTTCGAPAPVFAIWPAANWIKSSSCSATSRSRRRSATSDASRSFGWP
jgi:integrase